MPKAARVFYAATSWVASLIRMMVLSPVSVAVCRPTSPICARFERWRRRQNLPSDMTTDQRIAIAGVVSESAFAALTLVLTMLKDVSSERHVTLPVRWGEESTEPRWLRLPLA